jgi:hypothetical protein
MCKLLAGKLLFILAIRVVTTQDLLSKLWLPTVTVEVVEPW